ncbi:LLM class flavin-dependent oxidoreductase [Arthrobacter rhombi]|uniref:NtaA/DmoA family FMN-dependent monooxygenase n=1 Tax=Arthrobacter rhombi TaxID=71253 RepID=UPI0031D09EFA
MSDSPSPLLFSLYEQASVGCGGAPSLWTHPLDDRLTVNSLDRWRNVAITAEQANLDALFFADVLGLYDVYGGAVDAALGWAVEAPANDPFMYVPALAALTERLAFVITASTTYEHPFSLARRFGTLDHLSGGRIGWNIVTSYLSSAARNFGLDEMLKHADRYARGDEFMEVVYKLLEGSWAGDAVIGSKEYTIYARPGAVHPIHHEGEHFRVDGPSLTSPSPQRTPTLFQAGWSPRGREFAAQHAEVILLPKKDPQEIAAGLADINQRALDRGRPAGEVRSMALARIITAPTASQAQAKYEDLQRNYHLEAQLVSYAGDTGIDLDKYADNEPLTTSTNGLSSYVVTGGPQDQPLTAGDVRRKFSQVTRGTDLLFIGTPDDVANQIQEHSAASGLDGYMINPLISPGTLDDFAELVVPQLVKRGLYDPEPKTGTLRSRLRRDGADLLPPTSHGASFR